VDSDFQDFYAAFSERFRGPYEVIKERLRVHAETLGAAGGPPGRLVDLGVGRGEWLELAAEAGWACTGVDSNSRIVATARARGFDVVESDALAYVATIAPDSLGAVTAFHIIEHLPSPVQLRLFHAVFRALKPGGFLIAEWPNAEHPRVAQYNFWFDPTHQSLLPHELVTFMAEYVGFSDIRITRLDAGKVVEAAAMDIAMLARKP